MDSLKVFACGCLHGDTDLVDRAISRIEQEGIDLIVLCGDFVNPHNEEMALFKPFLDTGKPVVFVNGNHDSFALSHFLTEKYKVKHLHGKGVRYKHVGLFGCSGANVGVEQLTDEQFLTYLENGHHDIAYLGKKIMVTHVPPAGTLMDKMSPFVSCSLGVRKALDQLQPDIVLCAHVHEAAGMEFQVGHTRVLNVCKEGKVFEI